MLSLKSQYIKC